MKKISSYIIKENKTLINILIIVAVITSIMLGVINQFEIMNLKNSIYRNNKFYGQYNIEVDTSNIGVMKEILAKDKNISSFSKYGMLGDLQIRNKNFSSTLVLADIKSIEKTNYIKLDGRFPIKSNEVLLTSNFIKKNKISNKIGENYTMILKNEDDSIMKNMKVTGILYYDEGNKNYIKSSAYVTKLDDSEKKFFKGFTDEYYISYKNGFKSVDTAQTNILSKLKGDGTGDGTVNISTSRDFEEKLEKNKSLIEYIKNNILFIFVGFSFLLFILNNSLSGFIKSIHRYMILGMSKKDAKKVLREVFGRIYIYIVVTNSVITGVSVVLFNKYLNNEMDTNFNIIKEYFLPLILMIIFLTLIIAIYYSISCIILDKNNLVDIGNYGNFDKPNYATRNIKSKKIENKLIINRLLSSKFIIIPIIMICITGYEYITYFSSTFYTFNQMFDSKYSLFQENNYNLQTDYDAIEPSINLKKIKELRKIDGVSNINIKDVLPTKVNVNEASFTPEMKNILKMQNKNNLQVYLNGIEDNNKNIDNLKKFIEFGSIKNYGKVDKDGYVNVALMNSDYTYQSIKVFNNPINQKLNLILPNNKSIKVKITSIINNGWRFAGNSSRYKSPEIVLPINVLNKATGSDIVTEVNLNIDKKSSVYLVKKWIKNNEIPYILISKHKQMGENVTSIFRGIKKINVLYLSGFSSILFLFSLYTIYSLKDRENRLLRMVGISNKKLKILFLKQGTVYVLMILVFTNIFSVMSDYNMYSHLKNEVVKPLHLKNMLPNIYTPSKEIYIVNAVILILVYLFIIIYSNRYKMNKNRLFR